MTLSPLENVILEIEAEESKKKGHIVGDEPKDEELEPENVEDEVINDEEPEQQAIEEDEEEDEPKESAGWKRIKRERKEARAELEQIRLEKQELAERLARMEGRFEQGIQNTQAQPKQEAVAEAEPNRDYDPEGWARWKIAQQDQVINSLYATQKQIELNNQIAQAKEELSYYEDTYSAKNPDYKDAKRFLMDNLMQQQKVKNPYASPAVLKQKAELELLNMAAFGEKTGLDPAEALDLLAVKRGFKPKRGSKSEDLSPSGSPNLDKIRQNKAKSSNMLGMSGQESTQPSSQQIYNMTLAEQAKHIGKNWETEFGQRKR